MSDNYDPNDPEYQTAPADPEDGRASAAVRTSRFSWVWLVPIVAVAIAAFLGFRTLQDQGPQITITFNSAEGIVAGQTRVLHKAVVLGQVETVRLAEDMSRVVVTVRMRKEAQPYLTDQARFWVVRARLSAGSLSGIETLVSGSYIEMDPGNRQGARQYAFTGLEQPPGVRSDEPGRTFQLRAERLGSLGPGTPVFFRDIRVGEVLGYDLGSGRGPVTVNVFVRSPFDSFVRIGSHFWNSSGVNVQVGGQGIRLELESLQAVLAGGVAFDTPRNPNAPPAPAGAVFMLYPDAAAAQAAGYVEKQEFITYFESSVRGLTSGAAVEFYGIQVGDVKQVELKVDPETGQVRVRVRFEIQPERIENPEQIQKEDPIAVAAKLVQRGMRVQLSTASFLTGQKVLALDFMPNAPKAELIREGEDWVMPSQTGGLDNILTALSDISTKLDRVPLDAIGSNLNLALHSATGALNGVQELANRASAGLSPTMQRLPGAINALQDAASRAGRIFGSLDTSYGTNSQFQRDLGRAMEQIGDTARAIRLLADFLDRHPEALIRGRAGTAATR